MEDEKIQQQVRYSLIGRPPSIDWLRTMLVPYYSSVKPDERFCALPGCEELGSRVCSGCVWRKYCSVNHQRQHWKSSHKHECKRISHPWLFKDEDKVEKKDQPTRSAKDELLRMDTGYLPNTRAFSKALFLRTHYVVTSLLKKGWAEWPVTGPYEPRHREFEKMGSKDKFLYCSMLSHWYGHPAIRIDPEERRRYNYPILVLKKPRNFRENSVDPRAMARELSNQPGGASDLEAMIDRLG